MTDPNDPDVLADDELVEDIRCGLVPDDDSAAQRIAEAAANFRAARDIVTSLDQAATVGGLSQTEADSLAAHEATIRAGLDTFVAVGKALLAIRDGRLYRASHGTFEDYARERWSISANYGRRLIEASQVVGVLQDQSVPIGTVPGNEAQARPLAPLRDQPEVARAAWSRAQQSAPRTSQGDSKVTAKIVEQAVRDELAERRGEIHAAQQQAERDRDEVAEFNAATAHLIPQAERDRPWALAAIALSRAVEHLPLDVDPNELAANVPSHAAYRLDALDDTAMNWLVQLFAAHHVPNCTAAGGHP